MIYLDAATTVRTDSDVRTRMAHTLEHAWGNVSGGHGVSRDAKNLLEAARETCARHFDVQPDQIVFTSGATEALNLVIQGYVRAHPSARVFYSALEHPAVKKPVEFCAKQGQETYVIPVDYNGVVQRDILESVQPGDLVAVMPVNNEIGVINDVASLAELVHARGGVLLLDGVQSFYSFTPSALCAIGDYIVFSSHKLGGPQGVGCLVIKDRKSIEPLTFGGSQEWEVRPGTTPMFLIDAFSDVLTRCIDERDSLVAHIQECETLCRDLITSELNDVSVHAESVATSPHIISIDFHGLEAQMLMVMLDAAGVCVSRGSACASGASTPSSVLLALGIEESKATSTLRLSFSRYTTRDDIRSAIEIIRECVEKLRMTVGSAS